jgi:hypothetical protein
VSPQIYLQKIEDGAILAARHNQNRKASMAYGIIRIQKHNSIGSIRRSGKHKDREQNTPNADPLKTPENITQGAQTSDELVRAIQARVDLATIKAAGDYKPVLAVEYLITASPEFFKESTAKAIDSYFEDAKKWLKAKHGEANVVSITRHNDERSPHLSAFIVPLVERAAGSRRRSVIVGKDENGKPIRESREFAKPAEISLSARHYFGGTKQTLSELQTDFHNKVSSHYNLERGIKGSKARHQTVKSWYAGIEQTAQHVTFKPETVQPQLLEKNFWKGDLVETDEMVARRLTEAVQKAYAPAVEGAKQTVSERRRADEMTKTAKALEKRLNDTEKALKPILELAVLNCDKFIALVKSAAVEVEQIRQERSKSHNKGRSH